LHPFVSTEKDVAEVALWGGGNIVIHFRFAGDDRSMPIAQCWEEVEIVVTE
jgi:hypothetical protein